MADYTAGYGRKNSQEPRTFYSLEEVMDNLDTITLEEAVSCHDRLGICFTLDGDGRISGASYEEELDGQTQENVQVS